MAPVKTLPEKNSVQLHEDAVAQLVEALFYEPKSRGIDSRRSHWNFSVT
jgi:hypothetical protein